VKQSTANVLALIRRLDGACSRDFQHELGMARYSARILELRKAGFIIERSICLKPGHNHVNRVEVYKLIAAPDSEGQLVMSVGTGR